MGSEGNLTTKPRFDITMSKRTRKPVFHDDPATMENPCKVGVHHVEEKNNDHKSLKQLINGDKSKSRNSLGEHFTEEEEEEEGKQLQLVKLQQQKGVKLKRMVNRYVQVLSQLIKVKRDPSTVRSTKKPLLRINV
ncbi:uncharacterized protein LOC123196597 [Mangifera indica]|uniref:uncharacterized protein LOC123196597 n=1 Tax=Mangifera indica TaxID=29780 RepID=UPI001CFB0098|nr:uncharacterized protein LOC123196597 [Mangifera indica]